MHPVVCIRPCTDSIYILQTPKYTEYTEKLKTMNQHVKCPDLSRVPSELWREFMDLGHLL